MKKQRTSDVSLNTEDPIDVYLEFQTGPRGRSMGEDDDAADADVLTSVGPPSSTKHTLKSNPDYKPGPIRIYTREEIRLYEEDRDDS